MAVAPMRERGFLETLRSIRGCMHAGQRERAEGFDARHGVDTEKRWRASDLQADGDDLQHVWRYWPTLRTSFERLMDGVQILHRDFVFVDLGSGKGRVLLLASHYPFRRIVGVELSPALHQVAEHNVRAYRSGAQRCRAFSLLCMDAGGFRPPDDNLVLYLFQPFPIETLRLVLENLRASLERRPRELVIGYLNPLFHDEVMDSGLVRLAEWGRGNQPGAFDWAVYRHSGRSSGRNSGRR